MQVQNWMSPEVITVDVDTPLIEVVRLLEENHIRHLPVLNEGRLAGMITERDVQAATPPKAATVKAEELYYLLAEMKAKDVMRPNPLVIRPNQTMEAAAVKMLERGIGAMPVATEQGDLVGIISQGDVFRVLISITGVYQKGVQFAFNLEDRAGSIKEAANVIRDEGGQIVSILSTSDTADKGYRHVFIRAKNIPEARLEELTARLNREFMLLYVTKDPFDDV